MTYKMDLRLLQIRSLVLLVLLPAAVLGQGITLGLSNGSGAAGSTVSLPLTLSAPSGGGPAGVQWTLSYPTSVFTGINVASGAAASAAGKTLDCVAGTGSYTCLLTGSNDVNQIQSGTVATVTLTVSSSASSQTAAVQLTKGAAATPDGTSLALTAAGASVSITGNATAPSLSGLTCSPSSITVPASSTCTVSLSGASPSGGVVVSVSRSSTSATVSAPTSVTVPAGSTSASFQVSVSSASTAQAVTITAALGGVSRTFQLQVAPAAAITVSVNPASVVLAPGQQKQFSASVSGTTNTSVVWSASSGAITSAGLYTAPTTMAIQSLITVRATSAADSTKSGTASVTIGVADTIPPVISAWSATPGTGSATIAWTTNEAATSRVDYGTSSSSLGSVASDPKLVTAHSITLSGLTPGVTYYYRVTCADAAGNAAQWPSATSAPASVVVPSSTSASFWPATARPALIDDGDRRAVELGLRFRSDVGGEVLGVRFYKGSANTGTHVGNLWTSTGVKLATVTFSNETASGWQQAYFSKAVTIQAGATYVVSYSAPVGHYSVSEYFFRTTLDAGPLHASANSGVYRYAKGTFPTQVFHASNYWVDVVFRPAAPSTTPSPSATSLLPDSAQPATIDDSDSSAVELGVQFRSDVAGQVLGIRFFRGPANGGTHTGSLWTSAGVKLASVVFSNETSSGWQEAYFSNPVTIQAGVTYVVSYFAPLGRYSVSDNYFSTGVDSPPLHAPANAGVYRYGTSSFPSQTYQACNYWVDVIFQAASATTTAAVSPLSAYEGAAEGASEIPRSAALPASGSLLRTT